MTMSLTTEALKDQMKCTIRTLYFSAKFTLNI